MRTAPPRQAVRPTTATPGMASEPVRLRARHATARAHRRVRTPAPPPQAARAALGQDLTLAPPPQAARATHGPASAATPGPAAAPVSVTAARALATAPARQAPHRVARALRA